MTMTEHDSSCFCDRCFGDPEPQPQRRTFALDGSGSPITTAEATAFVVTNFADRKLTDEDVTADLGAFALAWLVHYSGDFDFLLDMQRDLRKWKNLSVGKVRGVLNCFRAQALREARETAVEAPPEGIHYLNGKVYKVQLAVTTSGKPYAKRLSGTSWDYAGRDWKALPLSADTLMTHDDAAEYGKLYGVCCICGRTLTDEVSIERGIGPICATKQGW